MPRPAITRDEVIQRSRLLPSFPGIVNEILSTLDDPDANFNALVRCINRDPVITARVLSVANAAASRGRRDANVDNIFTATSLVGVAKVRHIALISSLGNFIGNVSQAALPTSFWEHSLAICICCEELANYIEQPVSADAAMIAGLLHDIGQLWLYALDAPAALACWQQKGVDGIGTDVAERETFGIDHATVGAWLGEHWGLSPQIVDAIRYHHEPDAAPDGLLVPLVHVAEVLGNALDLTRRAHNRVTGISSAACAALGLQWDEHIRPLFGRIEARSSHANQFFSLGKNL